MVFKNADIYTMDHKNPHIADGYIRTENGVITAVGKMKDYQKKQDEAERDVKGNIVRQRGKKCGFEVTIRLS